MRLVLYTLRSFNEGDPYLIGLSVLSGCFSSMIHPICLAQASISTVLATCKLGRAHMGSTNIASSFPKAVISSLQIPSEFSNLHFRRFILEGAVIQLKFGPKRANTLHGLKNDKSSVTVVGNWSPCMKSIVRVDTSRCPGRKI